VKGKEFSTEFQLDGNNIDGFLPMKFMNYPINTLSGGTKKKLLVRMANIARPKFLMMDECTTGVDPIAAEKIIEYLRSNYTRAICSSHQGLIFSSHRIDESFAICEKVLMLVDGQVYINGPASMFLDLLSSFYQVDFILTLIINAEQFLGIMLTFLGKIEMTERIVIYSPTFLRITFNKQRVPISRLWEELDEWMNNGQLDRYYFRSMEMEEILAIILSTASS
jgi:energy-coupling factor transporter ATP-binding protein EcfA2